MWADVDVTGVVALSVMPNQNWESGLDTSVSRPEAQLWLWHCAAQTEGGYDARMLYEWGESFECTYAAAACFPSWQCLPGIIHETHPISCSACATHVFLFNLLVFSSSATTRTLPAIFFPARDKRITDVSWNVPFPPPLPLPSSCALTCLWQPSHSPALLFLWTLPIPCPLCGDTKLQLSPTRSQKMYFSESVCLLWVCVTIPIIFVDGNLQFTKFMGMTSQRDFKEKLCHSVAFAFHLSFISVEQIDKVLTTEENWSYLQSKYN